MKKILLVGPYPPPYGGISGHINSIIPKLIINNYSVITLSHSNKNKVVNDDNLKNIYSSWKVLVKNNFFLVLFNLFKCLKFKKDLPIKDFIKIVSFSTLINKTCYDEEVNNIIIYDNYNGLTIPILKKFYNDSYNISWMFFGEFNKRPNYFKSKINYVYSALDLSDKIFSSSKFCAESVFKVLGLNFKVDVIYIGVDDKIYFPHDSKKNFINKKHNTPSNSIKLFFLGRMVEDMGLHYILNYYKEILDIDKNIYLIIVGADGNLTNRVIKIANSNLRVKFSVNIPFDEKPYYYNSSDIILAPSMHNHACMGVTIKEAMACGKPVIASNSGGIPEAVIDKYNGFIIPFNLKKLNKKIFLNRIKKLVSNPLLRSKMGNNGYKLYLKKFTNDVTVEKYKQFL